MERQARRMARIAAGAVFSALLCVAFAPQHAFAQAGNEIISETRRGEGKPVEIGADQMEVNQDNRQAVFTGNVDAKRGDLHMTSNSLVVDYREVGSKQEITFLKARGSVVVVSKGQTVKAQWAKMDVQANTVVMGDSVTVFDGKSVIKGTRLELDLTTGESRFVGGRVQGIFN